MAMRNIKLKEVYDVEWETRGDLVVLKFKGDTGKTLVNVELPLPYFVVKHNAQCLQAGVQEQVSKWLAVQQTVGEVP